MFHSYDPIPVHDSSSSAGNKTSSAREKRGIFTSDLLVVRNGGRTFPKVQRGTHG